MKFGVVNKSTVLNLFVLDTLQRNITRLAVITRKTNIKLGILKVGNWKRALFRLKIVIYSVFVSRNCAIYPEHVIVQIRNLKKK